MTAPGHVLMALGGLILLAGAASGRIAGRWRGSPVADPGWQHRT